MERNNTANPYLIENKKNTLLNNCPLIMYLTYGIFGFIPEIVVRHLSSFQHILHSAKTKVIAKFSGSSIFYIFYNSVLNICPMQQQFSLQLLQAV